MVVILIKIKIKSNNNFIDLLIAYFTIPGNTIW